MEKKPLVDKEVVLHSMALALHPARACLVVASATVYDSRRRSKPCFSYGQTVTRARRRATPRWVSSAAPVAESMEEVIQNSGRTTDMAHVLWRSVCRKGDVAIDATAGNGWDTEVLADLVLGDDETRKGKVIAFDVQESAINSTRARIEQHFSGDPSKAERVQLMLGSHATLGDYVEVVMGDTEGSDDTADDADINSYGNVSVVCFNLGYLPGPGSDRSVVTETESTIQAVSSAVKSLRPGGVVTVIGYIGHAGGLEETTAVEKFVASLDPKIFTATSHLVMNRENCPRLIAVHRKVTSGKKN